ncbi:MAG TPA: flagellar biosynthesis protein FlhB [Pseudorhodoplanes sp.]|jgi:flagellar biosynthetic protein FlhB|nr:flagellar biosynthesis protein FlhB [Pseudorhodoplanes sp.]
MAEEQDDFDKSEDPTQKRLDDALERGDVAKSQEVSTWFIIAGATLILTAFSGAMGHSLQTALGGILANAHRLRTDGYGLRQLADKLSIEVLAAMAVPLLLLALAAIAGNIIQHRLVWSAEALKPKLSKISPAAGLGRLFSKQALANFLKGLAKLLVVGAVMAIVLWPERARLDAMVRTDPAALLDLSRSLALQLLGVVVALLAVIAGADFVFQYRQWYQRQKMSVREMKEEFKQTEGDPAIKARIRRIRETKMRKRMMAAVPTATVVITNPTHFAVALKYERGDNAPLCVAKGVDAIALKMREVAREHSVPIVENPPLARTLHATVQIDQEIPPEHYKAVAEVIGYVMRLRRDRVRH